MAATRTQTSQPSPSGDRRRGLLLAGLGLVGLVVSCLGGGIVIAVGTRPAVDGPGSVLWLATLEPGTDEGAVRVAPGSHGSTTIAATVAGEPRLGLILSNVDALYDLGLDPGAKPAIALIRVGEGGVFRDARLVARSAPEGAGGSVRLEALAVGRDGALTIAGRLAGAVEVGGRPFVATDGAYDAFVARLDPAGELAWVRRSEGAGERPTGLASIDDGGALVAGSYTGTPRIAGSDPLPAGFRMSFVARLERTGDLRWVRAGGLRARPPVGQVGYEAAPSVAATPDGGCLITADFSDMTSRGGGGDGPVFGIEEDVETQLSWDAPALARFLRDGELQWAKAAGGDLVAAHPDGGFVLVGRARGRRFEPRAGAAVLVGDPVAARAFIARVGDDGTVDWVHRIGRDVEPAALTVAPDGEVIVAGAFAGTVILGRGEPTHRALVAEGTRDLFVAAWRPDGAFAWAVDAFSHHTGVMVGGLDVAATETRVLVVGRWSGGRVELGRGEPRRASPADEAGTFVVALRRGDAEDEPSGGSPGGR